jgi:hypothetical protein
MTGRAQGARHQRRIAITGRFVISQLYSTRTRDAKLFVRYLSIVAQSGRAGLRPSRSHVTWDALSAFGKSTPVTAMGAIPSVKQHGERLVSGFAQ